MPNNFTHEEIRFDNNSCREFAGIITILTLITSISPSTVEIISQISTHNMKFLTWSYSSGDDLIFGIALFLIFCGFPFIMLDEQNAEMADHIRRAGEYNIFITQQREQEQSFSGEVKQNN